MTRLEAFNIICCIHLWDWEDFILELGDKESYTIEEVNKHLELE